MRDHRPFRNLRRNLQASSNSAWPRHQIAEQQKRLLTPSRGLGWDRGIFRPPGGHCMVVWVYRETKLTCAVTSWSHGGSGSSCADSGVRYLELLCVSIQLADTVRWSCENSATPSPRPLRTTSRSRVGFTTPSTTQTNLRPLPGPTGTVHMDVTNPSSDRDCQPVERLCSATSHVWC